MKFRHLLNEKEVPKEFEYLSKIIGEIDNRSIQNIVREIIFFNYSSLRKIPIKKIIKKHRPEFKI